MNIPNFNQWVAALRSGTYKQGTQLLHVVAPDHTDDRLCCLGIASMLAGIPATMIEADDLVYETGRELAPGEQARGYLNPNGRPGLASITVGDKAWALDQQPGAVNDWLGLPSGMLVLDAPASLFLADHNKNGFNYASCVSTVGNPNPKNPDSLRLPLFKLNDGGFTFPQIADLMEFFGISAVNN